MSLIYWENVLVGEPVVPFDITFRIVTDNSDSDYSDDEHEHDNIAQVDGASAVGCYPEVSAHKLVLGLTSPVFRTLLYGNWKEGREQVIDVKDVTYSAFRAMVNYIYGMPLDYSVEFLTLGKAQELFDIVYAAKKYLIPQLTMEIVALISKAAITTNTVEVDGLVTLANQFSHLEEASKALLGKCEEEKENAKQASKMICEKEKKDFNSVMIVNQVPAIAMDEPLPIIDNAQIIVYPVLEQVEDAVEIGPDVNGGNLEVVPGEVEGVMEMVPLEVGGALEMVAVVDIEELDMLDFIDQQNDDQIMENEDLDDSLVIHAHQMNLD